MNNEFQLRFNFRKKEWFRCMFYSDFVFNGRILRYLIPVSLLVFIAVFHFFRYKNIGNVIMLVGVTIVYILAIAVSFFVTANKQFYEYHINEETWLLNDNGVSGKMFGEGVNSNWSDIYKCEITKDFVYLYLNALLPIYLPRNAFNKEAFDFMIKKISEE